MDVISTILTVLGILVTILGAFWTWKAIFRPKIQLVSEDVTIVANIGKISSDLKVSYKDDGVSNDLILISAYLINVGNVDIAIDDVEEPVTIVLPSGAQWLSFQVERNNHNMRVKGELVNNRLEIGCGLWKKNEGFKFDALMTIHDESILKDKNEIFSLIKIKSRIKGLQGISVTRLPEAKTYKTKLARLGLFIPTILMICYILGGVAIYNGIGKKDTFSLLAFDNNKKVVDLKVINTEAKVIGTDGTIYKPNNNGFYELNVGVVENGAKKSDRIAGLGLIILGFLGVIMLNLKNLRSYLLQIKVEKS